MAKKEVFISIKVDKKSKEKLKILADQRDVSIAQVIREAIKSFLLSDQVAEGGIK